MRRKRAFEAAVGIPTERTYWTPGGFENVPAASDPRAREKWVYAIGAIRNHTFSLIPTRGSMIVTLAAQRKRCLSANSPLYSPRGRS